MEEKIDCLENKIQHLERKIEELEGKECIGCKSRDVNILNV